MTTPLGLPPVRVRGPALWCVAAVGTIYVAGAAYEVRQDAKHARRWTGNEKPSFRDLQKARYVVAVNRGRDPTAAQRPRNEELSLANRLPEQDKLMGSIMAANAAVYALERVVPSASQFFSHMPAAAANYTMLSSAFGHVGIGHLALNMYGLYQFLPPVAATPTFCSSAGHVGAFYLGSGVLSAFAFHMASVWPRRVDRLVPARGASGAVMALVGAFGAAYPNSELGIMFIPGSLAASDFLWMMTAFELYGLFVGIRWLPLAHAAHLGGLAAGSAYVYFDAGRHLWQPTKRWTFNQMRRLDMV